MKKHVKIIHFFVIFFILLTPLITFFSINTRNVQMEDDEFLDDNINNNKNLKTSDIAGTDLYSEQINVHIAGSKSLIRQSLFTNDTNIFPYFDTKDPAFYKCNVLISASNGMTPDIFPRVLTENMDDQYALSFNSFSGFLYYEDLDAADARYRAERALEIIKRKFEIDLMMVDVSEPNCFAFIGYYPNWEVYFNEITTNLPMDGYWKALNISRLTSKNYLEKYHLSSTFLLINSLDFLEKGFDIATDQVNFNFESIDLSILENVEMEELIDQFSNIMNSSGGVFGNLTQFISVNETLSQEDIGQLGEAMGTLNLANNSHYISLNVQYEGLDNGITRISPNQYKFNLWNALGYNGEPLTPSEKIYIALEGAFMSKIDINILCTDVIDTNPEYFEFSDYLIEQLGSIMFLAGIDFDIGTLKDYSFELLWANQDGLKRNYARPVNLDDPNDVINLLSQLGYQGFPYIPTGLLDPIDDFIISYNVSNSEPTMEITRELAGNNASYGINRAFLFNITAENVGNESVWGIPTSVTMDLDIVFLLLAGPLFAEDFKDAIWDVVNIEYPDEYNSIEEFLNVDEDPRIFQFDTLGTGAIDHYYPDITNISNLYPYNEKMDNVIDKIVLGYPQLMAGIAVFGNSPEDLKDIFTSNYSVWNEDNWKLEPGEKIFYQSSNISISNLDSFSMFYAYNFTINPPEELPHVYSGISIEETNASMALINDNKSWIIESEEKYVDQHEIEIEFFFNNQSDLDLVNNSIDKVSIIINFTDPSNTLSFEIFNFSVEEFQDLSPYLISTVNNCRTFSFLKGNRTLDWLFDPSAPENHTVIFKLKGIDTNLFNISINDLDVEFSERDIIASDVLGTRVIFATLSGNIQFISKSNPITLGTCDMASIIAISYLSNYSSKEGDLITYFLNFKNIGSNIAKNISISILIPGIINNTNDFILSDNFLRYNLTNLAPFEEKTLNFSFHVPNSGSITNLLISYNNSKKIQNRNSTALYARPNDVYFSAPIDYENRFPFVRTIEIDYDTSKTSPAIKDSFSLFINIKNTSPNKISIPDLNLTIVDQYGDLRRTDNYNLSLTNITHGQSKSVNITLYKKDWKGYYYPPINFLGGNESRTVQIYVSLPIILGIIDFSIIKSVDKEQVEIGNNITVSIVVKNNGTVSIKEFFLNDKVSFAQTDFSLIEGKLVNNYSLYLKPGESITFSYIIKADTQKSINLSKAVIDYYYLLKIEDQSNEVEVKIIIPRLFQALLLIIPCIIALFIISIYHWQVNKYKAEKYELQRNEMIIFGLSSRDSVIKIEHTLRDRLNIISKKTDVQEEMGKRGEKNE